MTLRNIPRTAWRGVGLYLEVVDGSGFFEPRLGCHFRISRPSAEFHGAIMNWKVVQI